MKIIVLGNGFDLGNGLPTSYNDFFDNRKYRLQSSFKMIDQLLDLKFESVSRGSYNQYKNLELRPREEKFNNAKYKDELQYSIDSDFKRLEKFIRVKILEINVNGVNFWDVFFRIIELEYSEFKWQWNNIEDSIKKFVQDDSSATPVKKANLTSKIDFNIFKPNLSNSVPSDYFSNILFGASASQKSRIILKYFYDICSLNNSHGKVNDYLLDQLKRFEETFQKYITEEAMNLVNKNPTNQRIYRDNLLNLIDESSFTNYFLINFNYTMFSNSKENRKSNRLSLSRRNEMIEIVELNVHGRFDITIIFGIDQTTINAANPEYLFTKTYRKLESGDILPSIKLPNKSEITEIVFYGHSLSQADYSYFQSMFDYYDIYNSELKLVFLYSIYSTTLSHIDIKGNQLKAITSLMHSYGETMSNKDHGKNLIHKLLLENRIEIRSINLKKILNNET